VIVVKNEIRFALCHIEKFCLQKKERQQGGARQEHEIIPTRNTHRYGSTKRKTPSSFRRFDAVMRLFFPAFVKECFAWP